ncbi:MAG: 50S ribosomal protein L33 [Candidatus Wildermuthbacteria bacterium RIFCSPHIGHO2_02_FULL_49_9]|uniref:Large ribosomal subunit protein bL33 n=3 Tax=Parcubacteria group TaxID=1794811 RepID=A0A1G2QVM9_9BACT|nr:MAG: 50S ribosomal protein L33 [Candidatus Yanofskybacteria bacterium RIFCSPLOWO2_02_FULL_47_9b]OHA64650.1 MAG: 50S ribosomal protein L33 [Candidatus Wildermuthbacteria bacterium RIFCSPHIGHO2_01_FULL_49_22b]OHA71120.1 MAG: 50S ribosomal protein L33 [Candidatus Wildermuthbacteria bacterium RIFCSPHIGHO2_02_FULL_49_9]
MQCGGCKNINYFAHKSLMKKRKEGEQKLEAKKFCKHCKKHTAHKECR